jgi:predicted DNA binding CopG/RHH family protein
MTQELKPITTIPEFKTCEEEVTFWDTHDIADLMEKGRPVRLKFSPKNDIVSIRFDRHSLRKVQLLAQTKGIHTTTLLRMWIMEKLSRSLPSV